MGAGNRKKLQFMAYNEREAYEQNVDVSSFTPESWSCLESVP